MVAILMMSAKLATLGLLKIKLFQNKGYDVIISVHDVTNTMNQIISRDSNHIVDVVIWPKFDNFNYFITSISSPKKTIFWGVLLAQVQWFRTSTRYGLQILHLCDKRFKTKFLGANSCFWKLQGKNWQGREPFCPLSSIGLKMTTALSS